MLEARLALPHLPSNAALGKLTARRSTIRSTTYPIAQPRPAFQPTHTGGTYV